MSTGTHATIQNLVWKTISDYFPVAEIKEKNEALPSSAHDTSLEMEARHCVSGELRKFTTTIV